MASYRREKRQKKLNYRYFRRRICPFYFSFYIILTYLKAIRLDSNNISDMVGLFNDLTDLRWLNISDNRISKFDYFLLPTSLNWLDIHGNRIRDIGNYFGREANLSLTSMDISFNLLETIGAKSIPDKIQVT